MLEILLVIYMSRKIGAIAAGKGHSRGLYITIFVLLWIFGEGAGFILGSIAAEGDPLLFLLCAYGGAAFGALLGYVIADNLPDCRTEGEDLELDIRRPPLHEPIWNADYFHKGTQPVNTDSEHIQLSAQVPPRATTEGGDSTGIQSR